MGLLDFLSSQGGGASGGGLLDFLRTMQPQQAFSGLQSDQAQYGQPMNAMAQMQPNAQPSPFDNAQWPYGPNGAPSQANAQMPQSPAIIGAQSMPAPQPQGPGVGDRLMAGLQSFGNGSVLNGIQGFASGQRADPIGVAQQQQQQAQNLTMRALIQKGVDPQTAQAAIGNPELLKTLVTQHYGPQTVQSLGDGYVYNPRTGKTEQAYTPTKSVQSLGEGYVWDSKQGKAVRAYTPEDKTPNSALEYKFYKDNLGEGETPVSYQKWLATKSTDPNKINVLGREGELWTTGPDGKPVILHKNEGAQAEATLDDATVKSMGAQYLAGDKSVMQNLGRGAQGAANIVKLRTEIYKQADAAGLNPKDIVNNFNEQAGNLAGQRSIGTRAANISLAANEANNMIPIALRASEAVPRGEWMPWNKMIQAYQTGSSSPELARFVAATNSLVNAYVRAVSPSGVPTDSMREHAYSMLNSAQSAKAYQAVTSIMQDEMKAALQAPEQVRKELRKEEAPSETPSGVPKAGAYLWMPGKGLVPKS